MENRKQSFTERDKKYIEETLNNYQEGSSVIQAMVKASHILSESKKNNLSKWILNNFSCMR